MNEREALLEALRDPLPPDVGWWPPAPGWWLLAALAAVAAALALATPSLLARRARRRRAGLWRRSARAELAALRARLERAEPAETLARASVLARRTLLAVAPRRDVAALHGEDWLAALDAASGGSAFSRGPGRLLASAPFERRARVGTDELAALLDALDALVDAAGRRRARR